MSDRDMRIRERAYHLWIDEGRPEGREAAHWDLARAQVAAEDKVVPTAPETADVPAIVRKPRSRKTKATAAESAAAEAVEPSAVKKPRAKQAAVAPAKPSGARKKG